LDKTNQWKTVEGDFLLPVRVLKSLYRGKFQAHIKVLLASGKANLPPTNSIDSWFDIHKDVYKKQWSVRIQEKYSHGKGVLNYLSRYLSGSPIKPQQIVSMTAKEVSFRYKDHRDGKTKVLRLKKEEFMRRYLMHQPERGVHTFRYYGLYGSQAQEKREVAESHLGYSQYQRAGNKLWHGLNDVYEVLCDCCGTAMALSYVAFRQRIEKPLIKESLLSPLIINVQQDSQSRPTYTGLGLNSS
jgi:hypothetical protein